MFAIISNNCDCMTHERTFTLGRGACMWEQACWQQASQEVQVQASDQATLKKYRKTKQSLKLPCPWKSDAAPITI